MTRSPFTGRNRVSMLLLWLWLPISVAAWLLNSAGATGVGWMLGIIAAAWSVSLVPVLLLVRMGRRKRSGYV